MWKLISKLWRVRLLTPAGVFRLLQAIVTTGVNLMAMLRLAAKLHPHRVAVVDESESLTFVELWQQAETLAKALHVDHQVGQKQKVAIACRNHTAVIKSIFAASRLGAHVFLLNPDMSREQILALENRMKFDFYIHDERIADAFSSGSLSLKSLPAYHVTEDSVDGLSRDVKYSDVKLAKVKTGNIVILTGGTTGQPKAASRKPSLFAFLPPFVALLCQVNLDQYRSVYVATPVYHGFGLASLFIGVFLGTEMHFTARFVAEKICSLIQGRKIEAVVLVPLMLQRMLKHDPDALTPLKCIMTGGAKLSPTLAQEVLEQLGPKLFNLFGTSEAGFCIMAKPELLSRKPNSIGPPIRGVRARIVDESGVAVNAGEIGPLSIRCSWAITRESWVETGDVAYRDEDGDVFLCGRVDDMIVSGGENVYPVELEHVLLQHPDIESAVVVGIPDAEFGQRLKAVVVPRQDASLDDASLLDWLKPRVARHQMPAITEFRDELPYTALGKLDRKSLVM